jgi:hypothetical protein
MLPVDTCSLLKAHECLCAPRWINPFLYLGFTPRTASTSTQVIEKVQCHGINTSILESIGKISYQYFLSVLFVQKKQNTYLSIPIPYPYFLHLQPPQKPPLHLISLSHLSRPPIQLQRKTNRLLANIIPRLGPTGIEPVRQRIRRTLPVVRIVRLENDFRYRLWERLMLAWTFGWRCTPLLIVSAKTKIEVGEGCAEVEGRRHA